VWEGEDTGVGRAMQVVTVVFRTDGVEARPVPLRTAATPAPGGGEIARSVAIQFAGPIRAISIAIPMPIA
jgi:hypothetical protein